jgi:hypothetical protein
VDYDNAGDVLDMDQDDKTFTIFDELGYIVPEKLADLTLEEVTKIIKDEAEKTHNVIEKKTEELRRLRFYLDALEHDLRTVWLLYQDDRAPERRVLG